MMARMSDEVVLRLNSAQEFLATITSKAVRLHQPSRSVAFHASPYGMPRVNSPWRDIARAMWRVRWSCARGGKMTNRSNGFLNRRSVDNLERLNNLSHRLCVAPMID